MSYQEEFSKDFDLGFDIDSFPVKLVDKSYRNDICPSFYFSINDQFFVLWTDYKKTDMREHPESKRYTVVYGINEGDTEYMEIYNDSRKGDILTTDKISDVEELIFNLKIFTHE